MNQRFSSRVGLPFWQLALLVLATAAINLVILAGAVWVVAAVLKSMGIL